MAEYDKYRESSAFLANECKSDIKEKAMEAVKKYEEAWDEYLMILNGTKGSGKNPMLESGDL